MTQATAQALAPHMVVGERFKLIRKLETGGMSTIWVARQLSLDAEVAIKFIDERLLERPEMRERFAREARTAASIRSRYVVQVLDYDEGRNGPPFIAMELLQGEHLAARLTRGPISLIELQRVVSQACRGLGKAHALGIIHRDIKPENLFLVPEEEPERITVKILDFGIAKFTDRLLASTANGVVLGTPVYMSPEQASGEAVSHRSDLYSLGIVAYQALTGAPPFDARSFPVLFKAILEARPPPVRTARPDVPESIELWFERALAKKPADRFSSAAEMAEAFLFLAGMSGELSLDGPRTPTGTHRYARFVLPSGSPDSRVSLPFPSSRGREADVAKPERDDTTASREAPESATATADAEPLQYSSRGTLRSRLGDLLAQGADGTASEQSGEPPPPPPPPPPPQPPDEPAPSAASPPSERPAGASKSKFAWRLFALAVAVAVIITLVAVLRAR